MKFDQQDFERLARAAIDKAVRDGAERLLQQVRAGISEGAMMRMRCEAFDPFFPREQVEDVT